MSMKEKFKSLLGSSRLSLINEKKPSLVDLFALLLLINSVCCRQTFAADEFFVVGRLYGWGRLFWSGQVPETIIWQILEFYLAFNVLIMKNLKVVLLQTGKILNYLINCWCREETVFYSMNISACGLASDVCFVSIVWGRFCCNSCQGCHVESILNKRCRTGIQLYINYYVR